MNHFHCCLIVCLLLFVVLILSKQETLQKKAMTHHPHSITMRTTSVIKSISLSASQLKKRHLLFATQYDNGKIIIPVRTQFHTSNTRCQQQSTPFSTKNLKGNSIINNNHCNNININNYHFNKINFNLPYSIK